MKINQFRINKYQEMNNAKPLAIFATIAGFIMFGIWSYFLVTGRIPEFDSMKPEVTLHFAVEICTAIMLTVSGFRVLFTNGHGEGMLLLSMGMLFYTLLNSSGYYADKVDKTVVFTFVLVLLVGISLTIHAFHGSRK